MIMIRDRIEYTQENKFKGSRGVILCVRDTSVDVLFDHALENDLDKRRDWRVELTDIKRYMPLQPSKHLKKHKISVWE